MNNKNQQPIIFCHYGLSDYLEFSLKTARKTNQKKRLIFLGDKHNKEIAINCGWEHYFFSDFISDKSSRFSKSFRHVQGKNHNPIKNNKDWLRFVFERWFFIESFVKKNKIKTFWHFDSDTMILQDLTKYEDMLSTFDFTVQCNNTCLNGKVSMPILSEFLVHICELFENETFLNEQLDEFKTKNPDYAFTEMRAFDSYKSTTNKKWTHLLTYFDNSVFDDCICQNHGFKMTKLYSGENVKNVFVKKGKFWGKRNGIHVQFVTLNLSWVPISVFLWVFNSLDSNKTNINKINYSEFRFKRILKLLIKLISDPRIVISKIKKKFKI